MSQDLESSLQAQQMLEAQRQQRVGLMGQDPDADARDKEESRLRSIVEELAPRDQRERYMGAALGRGAANEVAERAGKVGVLGRTAGAGLAGGLAGLTALMSLQNAGAQGQDAISGIGQSALRGAGTFSTLNPRLQELGGAIGSRLGGFDYGRAGEMAGAVTGGAANMAGRALGGAADMAGRAGGGIANLAGAARSRLAPPTPAAPTPAPPGAESEESETTPSRVGQAIGVATRQDNAATQTRDAMDAVNDMSVVPSMSRFDVSDAIGLATMGSEAMPKGTGRDGRITARDLLEAE